MCGNVDYDKLYNNINIFLKLEFFSYLENYKCKLDGDYDEFIKQYPDLAIRFM